MLTIRFEEDGPAHSLYRTGTFQIRGAPDPETLSSEADRLVDFFEEIGVPVSDPSFEHKTSVFLGNLDRDVDLETLAVALGLERVEYEPEQFPGLVFRPDDVAVTLLVFSTGKIIIGGTTDPDMVRKGLEELEAALP
jgi:transcription initiation factor TFIID TATA-box-binding protein